MKCFQLFTVKYVVSCGLSYMACIVLRYILSILTLWRLFIINGCWMLSEAFSASIEMIIWLLFFNLLMWCIILIDLWIFNHPWIPGINPTWSWCMILLMYGWIQFDDILLRIFASMFISDIGLWFSFLCDTFVWFWYPSDAGFVKLVWKCSFLCNFLE